jgi:predicted O-methyltransferase YrrM
LPAAKTSPDPFAALREATLAHRAQHDCAAYPYDNGALLGTLAASANARRVLELGTALGYTALWFAHGAPQAALAHGSCTILWRGDWSGRL